MKNEFKRFKLEKLGLTIIILEVLGATGLLVGLKINPILILSSLGLGLLMFCGLIVRINQNDSAWVSLPAAFFMILNFYVFIESITSEFK
ncbi:MAG: DoxX family protein [Flammeovirgaceae bacterium]